MNEHTNLALALSLVALVIASSGFLVAFQQWMFVRDDLRSLRDELATLKSALGDISGAELFPGERALHAKAVQERKLVVYTVWEEGHIVRILQAFSKRYPEIQTEYWVARNPEIIARVLKELEAGQETVDTILSDSAPPVLRAAGAIAPYETVQKDFLVAHDPTMPVVSLQIQALTYNTKRIKAADLPHSWEDVAKPKYKGMVALDDPMRAGPLSTQLAAFRDSWNDEARWTAFVKGLKALNVPVHRSTSAMFRLASFRFCFTCSLSRPAVASSIALAAMGS